MTADLHYHAPEQKDLASKDSHGQLRTWVHSTFFLLKGSIQDVVQHSRTPDKGIKLCTMPNRISLIHIPMQSRMHGSSQEHEHMKKLQQMLD